MNKNINKEINEGIEWVKVLAEKGRVVDVSYTNDVQRDDKGEVSYAEKTNITFSVK